jgi:hypothetical protein
MTGRACESKGLRRPIRRGLQAASFPTGADSIRAGAAEAGYAASRIGSLLALNRRQGK